MSRQRREEEKVFVLDRMLHVPCSTAAMPAVLTRLRARAICGTLVRPERCGGSAPLPRDDGPVVAPHSQPSISSPHIDITNRQHACTCLQDSRGAAASISSFFLQAPRPAQSHFASAAQLPANLTAFDLGGPEHCPSVCWVVSSSQHQNTAQRDSFGCRARHD